MASDLQSLLRQLVAARPQILTSADSVDILSLDLMPMLMQIKMPELPVIKDETPAQLLARQAEPVIRALVDAINNVVRTYAPKSELRLALPGPEPAMRASYRQQYWYQRGDLVPGGPLLAEITTRLGSVLNRFAVPRVVLLPSSSPGSGFDKLLTQPFSNGTHVITVESLTEFWRAASQPVLIWVAGKVYRASEIRTQVGSWRISITEAALFSHLLRNELLPPLLEAARFDLASLIALRKEEVVRDGQIRWNALRGLLERYTANPQLVFSTVERTWGDAGSSIPVLVRARSNGSYDLAKIRRDWYHLADGNVFNEVEVYDINFQWLVQTTEDTAISMSRAYLRSLQWLVSELNGVTNWRWQYRWLFAPLVSDLLNANDPASILADAPLLPLIGWLLTIPGFDQIGADRAGRSSALLRAPWGWDEMLKPVRDMFAVDARSWPIAPDRLTLLMPFRDVELLENQLADVFPRAWWPQITQSVGTGERIVRATVTEVAGAQTYRPTSSTGVVTERVRGNGRSNGRRGAQDVERVQIYRPLNSRPPSRIGPDLSRGIPQELAYPLAGYIAGRYGQKNKAELGALLASASNVCEALANLKARLPARPTVERGSRRVDEIATLLAQHTGPLTSANGGVGVDYGAGDLVISRELATRFNLKPLYVIDPKITSLPEGETQLQLVAPDALSTIPEQSVHLIVALVSLHHVQGDLDAVLDQWYRILAPDGRIVIREHDLDNETTRAYLNLIHAWYDLEEDKPCPYANGEYVGEPIYYRSATEWTKLFESHGFVALGVQTYPNQVVSQRLYYQVLRRGPA